MRVIQPDHVLISIETLDSATISPPIDFGIPYAYDCIYRQYLYVIHFIGPRWLVKFVTPTKAGHHEWNGNSYYGGSDTPVKFAGETLDFETWREKSGLDALCGHSTDMQRTPAYSCGQTGTKKAEAISSFTTGARAIPLKLIFRPYFRTASAL